MITMTGNMIRIPEISTIKYKYSIPEISPLIHGVITQNILIVDAWTKQREKAVSSL